MAEFSYDLIDALSFYDGRFLYLDCYFVKVFYHLVPLTSVTGQAWPEKGGGER